MIYAALLMHLSLVFINYRISRSWLYPPTAFALLWSLILFLLILSGDFFYPISASTLLIFFLGTIAFSAGALVSRLHNFSVAPNVSGSKWTSGVLDACLFLLIIMFPFYIQRLRELSAISGINDFWIGLRAQSGNESGGRGFGVFAYIIAIARLASFGAVAEFMKGVYSARKTYTIVILGLSYGILSAGRIGTITLIFSLLCILALNNKLKLKTLIILGSVFLISFILPAYLLGKGINKKGTFSENTTSMRKNIQVYFLGGPVAFDQAVSSASASQTEFSGRSFLFFSRLHDALHLSETIDAPPITFGYAYTPRLTNVYTIYFTYYSDFGLLGIVLIMSTLGALLSFFYHSAVSGHPIYILLYSFGFSMLMVTSANEPFLTSLSAWIQVTVFSIVLYKIPPLAIRRCRPLPRLGILRTTYPSASRKLAN